MSPSHRTLGTAAARGIALIACLAMLGCGSTDRLQVTPISPSQSVIPTVDPRTRAPLQNPTTVPTVDPRTGVPGPPPSESTPNYRGTSQAVFLTVTAQYFTATPPPTLIPTRRVPVGAGPQDVPPVRATSAGAPTTTTIVTVVERVAPGGAAALSVRTRPGAVCAVFGLGADAARLPLAGVPARAANGDGSVAWLWTIDPQAPAGALTIGVDCGDAGEARAVIRVER